MTIYKGRYEMKKKIEILAPAGSMEGLKAAIHAGCDAIYIGGTKFGARAYANNLDEADMFYAIDYAHIHHKKIYMTINTLLKNQELQEQLYHYIKGYYQHGLDAVIVQDLGVLNFIHENFPNIDIHASTQMSITMAEGAHVLETMGVTRIVNARELDIVELQTLRKNTNLEIESFVHGALCYCYSGQCLMSSMIGGRSGNRGRCAQPCRMPYDVFMNEKQKKMQEGNYLLSPKDICTIDQIPSLVDAGVDSFKIEGRMKRGEYAAGVTVVYRKYLDKYLELGGEHYNRFLCDHKQEIKNDISMLMDLYNRGGFTTGYYTKYNGKSMITLDRPNHTGILVGEVSGVKGNRVQIRLKEEIYQQDILEIRNTKEDLYEFTVKSGEKKAGIYEVNFNKGLAIRNGQPVYRTKNNTLLSELFERYIAKEKKESISGKLQLIEGKEMQLVLKMNSVNIKDDFANQSIQSEEGYPLMYEVTLLGDVVEKAKNQPITEEKARKQMLKTGETSFEFLHLEVELSEDVFVPLQKINELRRSAISALEDKIARSFRREIAVQKEQQPLFPAVNEHQMKKNSNTFGIAVKVSDLNQLMVAGEFCEVTRIYIDSDMVPLNKISDLILRIKAMNKECYMIFPQIFRRKTYQLFEKEKVVFMNRSIDGFVINTLEEYYFLTKIVFVDSVVPSIVLNHNLYVMNQETCKFWNKKGVSQFTTPFELNFHELKELAGLYTDMIVYGELPVMVSAQCVGKTCSDEKEEMMNQSCIGCGNKTEVIELMDRYKKRRKVVKHCRDCYNIIYNSEKLSLLPFAEEIRQIAPQNIRLDFLLESVAQTRDTIERYVESFIYRKNVKDEKEEFTRGHFKRGVE